MNTTINIYNELKNIDEVAYSDLQRKQGDISSLFSTFASRVKMVGTSGGSKMANSRPPDTWHFRIASATTRGKKYNAYIRFKNIQEELKLGVEDKDNWVKSGKTVDYRKLAADLLANVDVEVGCSCPADLYWGGKYIRTKSGSNYGKAENRPPRKRNPGEHGAYCKHLHLMLQTLPFYHGDMAKFLKTFYAKDIDKLVKAETESEEPKKTMSKAKIKAKPKVKEVEPKADIKAEPNGAEPKVEPEMEPEKNEQEPETEVEKDEQESGKKSSKRIGQKPDKEKNDTTGDETEEEEPETKLRKLKSKHKKPEEEK